MPRARRGPAIKIENVDDLTHISETNTANRFIKILNSLEVDWDIDSCEDINNYNDGIFSVEIRRTFEGNDQKEFAIVFMDGIQVNRDF